jgi:hypothetical protein
MVDEKAGAKVDLRVGLLDVKWAVKMVVMWAAYWAVLLAVWLVGELVVL